MHNLSYNTTLSEFLVGFSENCLKDHKKERSSFYTFSKKCFFSFYFQNDINSSEGFLLF